MKPQDNYTILTIEDLAKSSGIKEQTLEDFIEQAKERKKDFYQEIQQIDHLFNSICNYLRNDIVQKILKARGNRLPKDFQDIGLEGLTFGFDSPEVQRSMVPQPIYLSQDAINRLAGYASGQVLGLYDPNKDQIYLVDALRDNKAAHEEVLYHENYHRENRGASEGETRAATRAHFLRTRGYTVYH